MPLILQEPQTVKIDTVRITSFTASVAPRGITVSYERGYWLGDKFIATESRTDAFDAAALGTVDPGDKIYEAVKAALYQLVQGRAGAGTVK